MRAALLVSVRGAAYMAGWTTGKLLTLLWRCR
jgi:hypothetical protein